MATLLHLDSVSIPVDGQPLSGTLAVPDGAVGVVAFAHGSGSTHFTRRNHFVANALHEAGLATLLLDLLNDVEIEDRAKSFDIELLATRLHSAARWLADQHHTRDLPLGFLGAGTGAAAALVAATWNETPIRAVVSRGGRPDLAGKYLRMVTAPTLLIVGGSDDIVVELNEHALGSLRCPKRMVIIPRATHLFEEVGALEEVSRLATAWFRKYFVPSMIPCAPRSANSHGMEMTAHGYNRVIGIDHCRCRSV